MQTLLEALPQEYQQLRELILALARLVFHMRLFPASHPSVRKALDAAHEQFDGLFQRKKSIKLTYQRGAIYHLNFEVDVSDTNDKTMHLLREVLSRHSIGEVEFEKGMTREELASFAAILAAPQEADRAAAIASSGGVLDSIRIRHGIGPGELSASKELVPHRPKGEEHRSVAIHSAAGDSKMGAVVRQVLDHIEKIQSPEGRSAGSKILEVVEREGGSTATVLLLNSLREYDEYTFVHSVNVAVISAAVARKVALDEAFVDTIAHAALLHDIGKLYVPKPIIHKTGRLTPSEWQAMKRHPVDGERILREERIDLVSRRVAYEHHMRHDMTGYPSPKAGYAVHQASEIVRIADSYDALTTKRPYRKQINPYEAIKLMAKSGGTEFHPAYLGAFLRVLGNIPIGSLVKLESGETGIVVDISAAEALPRVRLLSDAEGREVAGEIIIDLNERDPRTNAFVRRIERIIEQPIRDIDVGKYIVG